MPIFKQINEVKYGSKTQTRRIAKNNEQLITVDGVKRIVTTLKNGKTRLKWEVGRDYAIKPSMYEKGIETHRIRVTDLREECVQDISEADAIAEGVKFRDLSIQLDIAIKCYLDYSSGDFIYPTARTSYQTLWDSINLTPKRNRWKANPKVWVIVFEVFEVTQ